MYHIEKKYDEEKRKEILNLLKEYYNKSDIGKKNSFLNKLSKNNINDKVLNKVLDDRIKNEDNKTYLTFYIYNDEELCGLLHLYKDKFYNTYNAALSVCVLNIEGIKEKNEILIKVINDVINKWEPFEITTISSYDDIYELLTYNGFDSYPVGENNCLMCKEVRERKYVRKRNNSYK